MPRRITIAVTVTAIAMAAIFALSAAVRTTPLDVLRVSKKEDGRAHYSGSWHFPRGGPYVLGFDAGDGEGELSINGRVVAAGRGEVAKRVVYPPGVVSVDIVASTDLRLLWHPPGRRGPLEYVLPSSLSPQSPDRATFSRWAGAAPASGCLAALLFAFPLAMLLWAFRPHLPRLERRQWVLVLVVFAVAAAVRIFDLDGAGPTWDEDVNWSAGRNYVLNLLALDLDAESWRWNFEHPPWMKYLAGIGALFADGYGPARALFALMGAATCAMLVPLVARLFGERTGFVAALLAALHPHLIGHSKIVGHETVALWWWVVIAALAVATAAATARPVTFRARVTLLGMASGLAVFSRFANGLAAAFGVAVAAIRIRDDARKKALVALLVVAPLIAIAIGYLTWPRLWPAPLEALEQSWSKLRKPHSPEFFLGSYSSSPPWYYFPTYLLATSPVVIVAFASVWASVALRRRSKSDLILLLWLLVPLVVAFSPVRQDGVRYIIAAVAGLAIAAASGLESARKLVVSRTKRPWTGAALLAVVILYMLTVNVRVHPYYIDYYGEHVGGPHAASAEKRFEIAWWGEGLDRAIAYINENAAEGDRVFKGCLAPSHLAWLRHDLWAHEARDARSADWILRYQPYANRCAVPQGVELAFEVEVDGARLVEVYRRAESP